MRGGTAQAGPWGFLTALQRAPMARHELVIMEPLQEVHPRIAICLLCGHMCSETGVPENLVTTCPRYCMYSLLKTKVTRALRGQHPVKTRFGDSILYRPASGYER